MINECRRRMVAYVRVSRPDQAENGVSLEAQRAKIAAHCVANDLDLVAIHEDAGVSAKSLDRPGLRAALVVLDRGEADGLLVTKLDRLTRSMRNLQDLIARYFEKRCAFVSIGDGIDTGKGPGEFILNILASIGQWERKEAGKRTSAALQHLKTRGVRFGPAPLGLKRTDEIDQDGRRVVVSDPEGAALATRIRALRAGGSTLRAISATLTAEGIPTRRGGKWAAETVSYMLRSAVETHRIEPEQVAA